MKISSYKDREVDPQKTVQVYRNLNKPGVTFSISQKIDGRWLVVAHAQEIVVENCTFKISEANRLRAVESGVKNVHAWVVGVLSESKPLGKLEELRYNMKDGVFYIKENHKIDKCKFFVVSDKGASVEV